MFGSKFRMARPRLHQEVAVETAELRQKSKSLTGEIADLEKLLCRIPEAAARRRLREIEEMNTIPPPDDWHDANVNHELVLPRNRSEKIRRHRRQSLMLFVFVSLAVAGTAHYVAEIL